MAQLTNLFSYFFLRMGTTRKKSQAHILVRFSAPTTNIFKAHEGDKSGSQEWRSLVKIIIKLIKQLMETFSSSTKASSTWVCKLRNVRKSCVVVTREERVRNNSAGVNKRQEEVSDHRGEVEIGKSLSFS